MSKYVVSCSPHLRDNVSTRSIMQDVCIAMLPACIAGVLFFKDKLTKNNVIGLILCFIGTLLFL
mgnify:CR=1 FL=1